MDFVKLGVHLSALGERGRPRASGSKRHPPSHALNPSEAVVLGPVTARLCDLATLPIGVIPRLWRRRSAGFHVRDRSLLTSAVRSQGAVLG